MKNVEQRELAHGNLDNIGKHSVTFCKNEALWNNSCVSI